MADLGKGLNLGLKGEKGARRAGAGAGVVVVVEESGLGRDIVCVREGDWERERRIRRYLYIT